MNEAPARPRRLGVIALYLSPGGAGGTELYLRRRPPPRPETDKAPHDDLRRFDRLGAEKIAVAPLGVDPAFFVVAQRRQPQPYFLAVSTLHPHKNLDRLMRAFAEFHALRSEFRLVIAGMRGFHTGQIEKLRAELGLENAVHLTGWIPREELYDLFAGAFAFFYPSTFEGFGLPVLEALAAAVPTACSNIQPIAGIAGEAALTFDPGETSAILDALKLMVCADARPGGRAAIGP